MPSTMIIVFDVAIFIMLIGGLLVGLREVEIRMGVRRRLAGKTRENDTQSVGSLFRPQGLRNPFLAWVQGTSLKDPKERQGLRRDLFQAGFEGPAAPATYVVIRFTLAMGLPLTFVLYQQISANPTTGLPLSAGAIVLSLAGFLGPRMYINNRISTRINELENEFPDALDLLVVCTEAGLGFEAAFMRVSSDTTISHPMISKELVLVTQELRAGRTRAEALRGLADRNQSDAVKSFVALLIQTDALGGSIAQSLRTYAQEMRQSRMLKAEEKAMRIPILLTIPLVLFILPVILVAVMLPAVIGLMRNFDPVINK